MRLRFRICIASHTPPNNRSVLRRANSLHQRACWQMSQDGTLAALFAMAREQESAERGVRETDAFVPDTGDSDDAALDASVSGRPSSALQNAWVVAALRRTRSNPSPHAFRALAMTDAVVDLASAHGDDPERYAFALVRRMNQEVRRFVQYAEREQRHTEEYRSTAVDYAPFGVDVDVVAVAIEAARSYKERSAAGDAREGAAGRDERSEVGRLAQAVAAAVDLELRAPDGTWPYGKPREWPNMLFASLPAAAIALALALGAPEPLPPSDEAVRIVAARLRSHPKVLSAALQRAMEFRPTRSLAEAAKGKLETRPAVWWRPLAPTMPVMELHERLASAPGELLQIVSEHMCLEGKAADAVYSGEHAWPETLGLEADAGATAELEIAADGSVLLRSARRRLPRKALSGATDDLLADAPEEGERKLVLALPAVRVRLGPEQRKFL